VVITIVAFLGILAGLVLTHEFGHFAIAKAFRVKVEEFGIGFPPRLFSVKRGETRYSLNAIPMGGFTKMAGEEDPKIPGSLASKPRGIRIFVLSAGPLMNVLLPVILFSAAFMIPHNMMITPVLVENVAQDSPAAMAGMEAGDVIVSINERSVRNVSDLHRYILLNLGREISIMVKHSDSTMEEVQLVPRWKPPPEQGAIGVELDLEFARLNQTTVRQSYPPWEAAPMGVSQTIETFTLFKNEIMSWFIRGAAPEVVGPVGVAQITGELARMGISPLMQFTAFFSINLALINILPLPALDGGRIAFVILEWIRRGKRVSPKTEGLVHFIGFALLIGVIMIITYQDIIRIIGG